MIIKASKVYQQSPEKALKNLLDIKKIIDLAESKLLCKHEKWKGCPEVNAYCAVCLKDEYEVHIETEKAYEEARKELISKGEIDA